jgi:type I restriction enzyme S subunit
MTTAEKYRQLEKSPVINIARFIFNDLKKEATNTTLEKVITDIKTGKTPSKQVSRFYEDDYFDWFKPDEIGSEKYLYDAKDKVSKHAYETKQATIFQPDTILINAIGDVGRISILKKQASSNQQITGIRLNEDVFVDYAYFYLLAHREFFYVDLFQTTLPIVNQKKINTIPFCYPSLAEQKIIVEGLEEIEKIKSINDLNIIDNLNWKEGYKEICRNFFNLQFGTKKIVNELTNQLNLIKQLRQAFLREAMQGNLVKNTNTKETGQQLLEKIKAEKAQLIVEKKLKKEKELAPITEEDIPFKIPAHWAWCRLGETGDLKRGKSKHRPRNDVNLFLNGKYPFIQTGDVSRSKTNGYLINTINGYYNDFGLAQSEIQKEGTLCITIAANIAECGFLGFDACTPDSIVNYISISKIIEKYVFYYLIDAKDEIEKYAPATAQKNINLGILNDLKIPFPPLHEQEQIVAKLEELMIFCDGLEQSIKESQGYNEKLLQQVLREALQPKIGIK